MVVMNINKRTNKAVIDSEIALYIFTSLLFIRGVLVDTLGTVFGHFGIPTSQISTVFYLAMWVCLLLSMVYIIKKCIFNKRLWCFLSISSILILFNIIIYPLSSQLVYKTLLTDIPAFQSSCLLSSLLFVFVGVSLGDFDRLLIYLEKTAKIGLILAVIRTVFKLFVISIHTYDDMNFAYELCTLVCIICAEYMSKKSKNTIVFLIAGFIMLLLSGTRGPIVAVLCFILIAYILQGNSINKILTVSLILLAVALCFWFGVVHSLVESLSALLKEAGLNFRIVDMFLEGSISDDSGRQALQENIISSIWRHPLIGNGIGMDQINFNYYAHNIIIELMFDFGIPIGLTLVAWILIKTYKSVRYGSKSYSSIVLALFCAAFIKLVFSQTYLSSSIFFIYIGILLGRGNIKLIRNE